MAVVHLEVHVSLRRLPGLDGGKKSVKIVQGTPVGQIIKDIGAAPGEIGLILCNGKVVKTDKALYGGEKLEFFPIFGGG